MEHAGKGSRWFRDNSAGPQGLSIPRVPPRSRINATRRNEPWNEYLFPSIINLPRIYKTLLVNYNQSCLLHNARRNDETTGRGRVGIFFCNIHVRPLWYAIWRGCLESNIRIQILSHLLYVYTYVHIMKIVIYGQYNLKLEISSLVSDRLWNNWKIIFV